MNGYRGHLTAAQVAEGMNAAQNNAARLLQDANLLFDAQRFPSCCALAILAIEEAGKGTVLRSIATASTQEQITESWRGYRSHTRKNAMWKILEHINFSGRTQLEEFMALVEKDAEHPYELDNLKQLCFYTDCLDNRKWSIPENVAGEELARGLLLLGRIIVATAQARQHTAREVELWQIHVGPLTHSTNIEDGKRAVGAWFKAMQAEGLYPLGDGPAEFLEQGFKLPADPKQQLG